MPARKSRKRVKTVNNFIGVFKTSVVAASVDELRIIAEELRDDIIENIERQNFTHTILSEKYLAQKKKKGLDERILIASKQYLDSFLVQRIQTSKDGVIYVVTVKDEVHPDSELTYRKLARIHEFGTQKIPARPHWRPTWSKFLRGIRKQNDRIKREILKKIRNSK